MYRRLFFIILLFLLALPMYGRLQKGAIGVGGEVGSLIDANVNWYLGNDRTLEGIVSFSDNWFLVGGGLRTYWLDLLDYDHDLFLTYTFRAYAFSKSSNRSPFHKNYDDWDNAFGLAAIAAAGVSFMPDGIPIEPYIDLGIGLALLPETEMFPSGELGLRIYF